MTKRKDDETPDPPGGRAAERLREFEESRAQRSSDEDPLKPEEPSEESPQAPAGKDRLEQ
jgi:hypothetical protein